MKKNYFLALLFAAGATALSAQTSQAPQPDPLKDKLAQRIREVQATHQQANFKVEVRSQQYNFREKEILERINTPVIPESFPVFQQGYTDDQYEGMMNAWYTQHPELLRTGSKNEQK